MRLKADTETKPVILMLCTGNAARSVMAGAMLVRAELPVVVATAGTHALENQPMSHRTRQAMASLGLASTPHRSRQLTDAALDESTLVVAMSEEHVWYIRRRHPHAAAKTATIKYLAYNLPEDGRALDERVQSLQLHLIEPEAQGNVADPAGREDAVYLSCARELMDLVDALATRVVGSEPGSSDGASRSGAPLSADALGALGGDCLDGDRLAL